MSDRTDSARTWWEGLARAAFSGLQAGERLDVYYAGESSDFARFNAGRVRQGGTVEQNRVSLSLSCGARQASSAIDLAGQLDADTLRVRQEVAALRALVPALPEDPWLLLADGEPDTVREVTGRPDDPGDVLDLVVGSAPAGADVVGIYAAGTVRRAFASSTGQRNWHEVASSHLDWSAHRQDARDRAVKKDLAGPSFDASAFERKAGEVARELEVLARPAHKVAPGRYRAWLGPAALHEWMQMLAWGGFGLKAQRTKQSPLLRMLEGDARFGTDVHLEEHVEGALAPAFQGDGFARPARVPLVTAGAPAGALVSPRSSREFGVPHTGASDAERPEALTMAGGSLAPDDVLGSLGTGLYVGNLWYLNFSDRMACRATGMTRFATFWVEGGEIVAPVDTMRFDETAYHMLGDNLVAIGSDVETLADGSTYGARSTDVWRLPGVLVEDYALTL
ncbi:MAG: TldD/PmbA family protein [Planctomycetes bacterium]|nr:TldD/PmbA family protein [Planctomycetota bacterium]MCB9829954.1 TldD/PmbA family protein [Planctomycetota bacterium]MCB9900706.1 TldD/PmbA family protein [Planctomycetota bacterium]